MSLTLKINVGDEFTKSALQQLTEELNNSLRSNANLPSEIARGKGEKGSKGDPITIGTILLASFTSGAAVAFFNTIKTYFLRTSKIEFELEKPDGTIIRFSKENVSSKNEKQTLDELKSFLNSDS